jgi:predicted transcriptional regulator
MVAVTKPLLSLTAADLMNRTPLVIPQEMSLRTAAHLLTQEQVSGAPVVDVEGHLVGILSATDFVHLAEEGEHLMRCHPHLAAEFCAEGQMEDDDVHAEETVSSLMTADPVTATLDVSIGVVAQMMLDAHIHRLIVVDRDKRPTGVVSSTDILAAVAQAASTREAQAMDTESVVREILSGRS